MNRDCQTTARCRTDSRAAPTPSARTWRRSGMGDSDAYCSRFDGPAQFFALCIAVLLVVEAPAQHAGDIGVGRNSARQLMIRPYDPNDTPCFDPNEGIGLLVPVPDPPAPPTSFRSTSPGFDANFPPAPEWDYWPLEYGASIRLVAAADMTPAFHVKYSTQTIRHAGDWITLGSYVLHRHPVFIVDCNDPTYDPIRTLWWGTFVLQDVGSTGYTESAPFTLRFGLVHCQRGDVNGDGEVTFADIDPFVEVLNAPEQATLSQRCAADTNLDGYVTFADIDGLVELLSAAGP